MKLSADGLRDYKRLAFKYELGVKPGKLARLSRIRFKGSFEIHGSKTVLSFTSVLASARERPG